MITTNNRQCQPFITFANKPQSFTSYLFFMLCFNTEKKTQSERVLELLLKHGTVTSLQLSQMHPVILNFHEAIHDLRQKHNIETVIKLVKGIKHTSYIYHGRLSVPFRWECKKKYTQDDIIKAFNA